MLGKLIDKLSGRSGRRDEVARRLAAEAADLFGNRDLAAARAKVAEALVLQPKNISALQLQGAVLAMLGQAEAALASFRAALDLDSKNASLCHDYGNALCLAGDLENAELAYRRATELAPRSEIGWRAMGNLLLDMKRPAEAAAAFRRALDVAPANHEIIKGLGKAVFRLRNFREVCDLYFPLYDKNLLNVEERYFLGTALLYSGRVEAAGDVLAATHAIAPEEPAVAQMLGFKQLFAGNWQEGFRLYEWRHAAVRADPELPGMKVWIDYIDTALAEIPAWTDGGCTGKRLLVWTEQGLGDAIMLLRLLPVLREQWQAAEVTLLCPPQIATLEPCCDGAHFIPASAEWKASPGQFDAHCSIMSLPHLMGIVPERIPGYVPYLSVPPNLSASWRDRTGALPGLKVGLAWSGSTRLTLDALRSMALAQLKPVLSCVDVAFVSLQKDAAAREELKASGLAVSDWMDECDGLIDTAALMANLDLVISVDTAVAHLAGALGRPVWLLNRFEGEWRWLRNREDSVWYPSMRIFNQTESRNWGPVIERVADELRTQAGAARQ